MTPEGAAVSRNPLLGRAIGSYRVLEEIGRGDAGEVYAAIDTRLGRRVALKVLPASYDAGSPQLHRFQQETRSASALNHPNIPVVHEIGEEGGRPFIVTELVEGRTLRETLLEPIPPEVAARIALQICGALAAAHHAGIVHRNLTPETVLIRPDGYVKVIDFGLAPLNPGATIPDSTEQPDTVFAGARADIVSLGAILREMNQPSPEWHRIAAKALEIDPAGRYASIDELAADLTGLRRTLETESAIKASSSSALLPPDPRRRKFLRWGSAIAGAATAAVFAPKLLRRGPPVATDRLHFITLSTAGPVRDAAISPDAKFAAYSKGPNPNDGIYIKPLSDAGGADVPVVQSQRFNRKPAYSRDGNYLYFHLASSANSYDLYRQPAMGGSPQFVLEEIAERVTFSPDGKRFLFHRSRPGARHVLTANADGSGERILATIDDRDTRLASYHWTPDGRHVQYVLDKRSGGNIGISILQVPATGGPARTVLAPQRFTLRKTHMFETAGIFALSVSPEFRLEQIYYVTIPEGRRYRLTNDSFYYVELNLSADGRTILTSQRTDQGNLFEAHLETNSIRRLTTGVTNMSAPAWVGNDIVYSVWNGGPRDLWQMPAAGGASTQLTTYGEVLGGVPSLSPDRRWLAYAGVSAVWLREIATGKTRQLVRANVNSACAFSPDGKFVYYDAPNRAIWKVPFEGGTPVLCPELASLPTFSPSGRLMAYDVRDDPREGSVIAIAASGDPSPPPRIVLPASAGRALWVSETDFIYAVPIGSRLGFWRYSLNGGGPVRLFSVNEDKIMGYDLSADGKRIVYAAGRSVFNLVKITGFR